MTELVLDTAKIRILKLLSKSSKNRGSPRLIIVRRLHSFIQNQGMDRTGYLVSELATIFGQGLFCRP